MADPQPEPTLSGGGGLARTLKTALDSFDSPQVAIIAGTQRRGHFILDLCRRAAGTATHFSIHTPGAAGAALRIDPHDLVILDASIDPPMREELRALAKKRVVSCKVLEIRSRSTEPPL